MNKPTIPSNLSDLNALFYQAYRFFIGFYLVLLVEFILLFSLSMAGKSPNSLFFIICVSLTYPLLYMLPGMILTFVNIYLFNLLKLRRHYYLVIVNTIIVVTSGTVILVLLADYKIYSMFNFHINGFVLNLICTPGGIESMGASTIDKIVVGLFILSSFSFVVMLLWLNSWLISKIKLSINRAILLTSIFFISLIIMGISEHTEYAYYNFKNKPAIFAAAQKVPLYIHTSMNRFFRSLGIKAGKRTDIKLAINNSVLCYPLNPIKVIKPKHPFNIVWLVAESWRADTLNQEIMPATTAFSQKALFFHNHYSAGNGTRMAMFGMFYSLYGSYWDATLSEQTPPVIMQVLKKNNYQFDMFTSAKFTYPEFDKTIFSNIDARELHQSSGRGGFINDENNITDLLEFIKERDKKRPFMTFMFFESPHAPYTFPDNCIIKKDYLSTFNYSTINIAANIHKIKNRYLNSVYHLDTQLDRVFKFLKKEKLMKNTIVIVTGDHGEEFMEKGHWGHNQSFHEEQVRVPLLIYLPAVKHQNIQFMSSHLDIVPTIAPFIGITNSPEDYSLGFDLLGSKRRAYTGCSSWDKLCYIDNKFKYELSPTQYNTMTTVNDADVTKAQRKLLNKRQVFDLMKNASRFYLK